jgi:hypothetical protein
MTPAAFFQYRRLNFKATLTDKDIVTSHIPDLGSSHAVFNYEIIVHTTPGRQGTV